MAPEPLRLLWPAGGSRRCAGPERCWSHELRSRPPAVRLGAITARGELDVMTICCHQREDPAPSENDCKSCCFENDCKSCRSFKNRTGFRVAVLCRGYVDNRVLRV